LVKLGEVAPVALGDQDVSGASEVGGRLAQGAARKEVLVSEGGLAVDQDDVKTAVKFEVLEPVIEEQEITSEFLNGMTAASHAVLVNDHGHAAEILRKHEWLVSGGLGIEQDRPPFGDDAHGGSRCLRAFSTDALVAAAQDRDLAAPLREVAGQFFHHGGLAGSADGEVADTDDGAAELMAAKDMRVEETEAQGDDPQIEKGEGEKNDPENAGTLAGATLQDDVDRELFETVEEATHDSA
jgi:hypothetical protein